MPRIMKTPHFEIAGLGALTFPGFVGAVRYFLTRLPAKARAGGTTSSGSLLLPERGGFVAAPDIAEAAFRNGQAVLQLEDGSRCRLTMVGHTQGGDTTYFEALR